MNKKEVIEYMIQSNIEMAKECNAVLDRFDEIVDTALDAIDKLTDSEREEVKKEVSENMAVETRETINVLTGAALTREMRRTINETLDILEEAEKKKRGEKNKCLKRTNIHGIMKASIDRDNFS